VVEVESTGQSDSLILAELSRLRTGLLSGTLRQLDARRTGKTGKECLGSIDHETDTLRHLLSSIIGPDKKEVDTINLEKEDCSTEDLFNSIKDEIYSLTRHHVLKMIIPPGLPGMNIDRRLVGQTIICLVRNAVQNSPENTPIIVEVRPVSGWVSISVADRGVGIPSRLVDKVFDRFHEVENIIQGRNSRNDLRLARCRSIIEAHGCWIKVESKVGDGSKFSFTLPITETLISKP
jgi:K+-sensing histidine kinase KdpD